MSNHEYDPTLTGDELFRHLDFDHGIDPNTIEDDHDPEAIHEREHDDNED